MTASFSALAGLKAGTRFADISTFSPVLGFFPVRAARSRNSKVPRLGIASLPSAFSASVITSVRAVRAAAASFLLRLALMLMAVISSYLFIFITDTSANFYS